jgi:hypothetical protein
MDRLKRVYEEAVNIKNYKDEEKAIKIVERLYPKLLKAAKKRKKCYEIKGGFWGPSNEVLKKVAELASKEGFPAVFVEEHWFMEFKTPAHVRISGWAQ